MQIGTKGVNLSYQQLAHLACSSVRHQSRLHPLCQKYRKGPRLRMSIIKDFVGLTEAKANYNDDWVDRLNYLFTASVLGTLALTIFAKDYVGEPLQCWVPKQWTDVWEAYAEKFCFIENTYFVSMNDTHLPHADHREQKEMIYYQWVPFILALMAFFFAFPRVIWEFLSRDLSVGLTHGAHKGLKNPLDEKSKCKPEDLVGLMEHVVPIAYAEEESQVKRRTVLTLFNYYLLVKILTLTNIIVQLCFLDHFLGASRFWGFTLLFDLFAGRHWQESGFFPRVAFCDVTVRELGNTNRWTVQCVLMVNMFNEKIFIIIWFWLALLLCITFVNMIKWLVYRFIQNYRRSFLEKLKKQSGGEDVNNEKFYSNYLKDDGVFVLRILDMNAGRIISSSLYLEVWKKYKEICQPAAPQQSTSSHE